MRGPKARSSPSITDRLLSEASWLLSHAEAGAHGPIPPGNGRREVAQRGVGVGILEDGIGAPEPPTATGCTPAPGCAAKWTATLAN